MIALGLFGVAVLGTAVFYFQATEAYKAQAELDLVRMATSMSRFVDGDLHNTFRSPEQEATPEYQKAITPLRRIMQATPHIQYIYTCILLDDQPRFILDAAPPGDADGDGVEDHSSIMDVYDDASPDLLYALRKRVSVVTEPYQDKWGTFISAYVPFFDSHGDMAGVVGVDLRYEDFQNQLGMFSRTGLLALILPFICSILAGSAVYGSQKSMNHFHAEQSRDREALKESTDRIRNLIESAHVIPWEMDASTLQIRYVGRQAVSRFGHPLSDWFSDNFVFSQIHPEDRLIVEKTYRDAASSAHPYEIEYRFKDSQETYVWIHDRVACVEDHTGTKVLRGFMFNITERKNIESALIMANRQLKNLDVLKTEFVNSVSHELRTPLAIIKEGISQVENGILGPVTDRQKQTLLIALRSINRLTNIVNNLLDLAAIESGKLIFKRSRFDFSKFLHETAQPFIALGEKKGLQFKEFYPVDPIWVSADEERLIQVLTNLLNNAIQYTDKGQIRIEVSQTEKYAECRIADTGRGISSFNLPMVFERFQRFDADQKVKGTGLGLSICRRIVEAHGGQITIESRPNEGSAFTFTIPKDRD